MSANYSGLRQRESNVKPIADSTASDVQPDLESQSLSTGYDHGWNANATSSDSIQHRDALGRVSEVSRADESQYGWYLDPDTAKLKVLRKIQTSKALQSKVPWVIRAAASAYQSDGQSDLKLRPVSYAAAAFAIPFLLLTLSHLEARVRNGGRYDRVLYRDWFPVDVAKNKWEAESSRNKSTKPGYSTASSYDVQAQRSTGMAYEMRNLSPSHSATSTSLRSSTSDLQERLLGPRRLCFVDAPATGLGDYVSLEVSEWLKQRHGRGYPKYLFLSYTSAQFVTQSEEAIQRHARTTGMHDIELEDRVRQSATNRGLLTSLAARVARERGLDAFWIDFDSGFERGQDADKSDSNAYAICDFLRASTEMIIVVGPTYRSPMAGGIDNGKLSASRNEWLASWGDRLWTLPELLICPNSDGIAVYTPLGHPPENLSKHTIARMLKDGNSVRELVEHYTGTIQLSPLELTVTATQCLFARPYNTYSAGDASYALMGLMRRRPRVDKSDSAFKAFARLSLLNDNDRLLERLICLQPDPHHPQPWYSLYDDYQASLWDIEPCTQVAGIVDPKPGSDPKSQPPSDHTSGLGDTQVIVLDGAFGAHIRWKSLKPVAYLNRPSVMHVLVRGTIRMLLFGLILGLILVSVGAYYRNQDKGSSSNTNPNTKRDVSESIRSLASMASRSYTDSDYTTSANYYTSDPFPTTTTDNFPTITSPPAIFGNTTSASNDFDKVMGNAILGVGLIIFLPSLIVAFLSPYILRRLYAGKLWATQAAFFGVSGIPDLAEVERCIFGFNQDRLKWSTHGSKLSTPEIDDDTRELIPQRPTEPARDASSRLQTFTLIDTFTLTATVFEAERVPVAAIICGQEGGMQRALLCSYDPATRAFCQETVLRMKTLCLERMPRVDRFRFAMRRR